MMRGGLEDQVVDDVRDVALINRYLAGEAQAAGEVGSWAETALRSRFPGIGNEVEDLKQEVHTRLIGNLRSGRFLGRSALRTYVHRISLNAGIDFHRRAHRRHEVANGRSLAARQNGRASAMETWIDRDVWRKVMASLPEGDRLLVLLVFRDHLSLSEVGDSLGITEEAARKRLDRCKRRVLGQVERLMLRRRREVLAR